MVIYTLYFQERLMKARSFFSRLLTKMAIILSIVLFLLGCGKANNKQTIVVSPVFNGQVIGCDVNFTHENTDWRYQQFLFFISNLEALTTTGSWIKPELLSSKFQTKSVALIGETCGEENHWQLNFSSDVGISKWQKLRLTIGVPFEVNHINPLTQESPLNLPTMFWGWQKGHKFLRLELASEQDTWLYHLGSMGCKAASPLRAPLAPCLHDNKFTFEVDITRGQNHQAEDKVIVFDVEKLVSGLTLGGESSCQSSPRNESCQQLVSNLQRSNKNGIFKLRKEQSN